MNSQNPSFPSTPNMRAFAAGFAANVPVLFWDQPGVGKSAKLCNWIRTWGYHPEVVVGGNREAPDFLGHQYVDDDNVTRYTDLGWAKRLRESGKGCLLLDELSTAAPSTQKGMLRVAEERYVGEHHLGEETRIVAIANPPEVAADGWDLPAPSANRFMHLDWDFDQDEWLENFGSGFSHVRVPALDSLVAGPNEENRARAYGLLRGFLESRPNLIKPGVPTDPSEAGTAWASPRMWTKAFEAMAMLFPRDTVASHVILKGCVGEGPAREFRTWVTANDLHRPGDVLDDPSIVDWAGERPDRLFALCASVSYLAGEGDEDAWTKGGRALAACASAGKPDVATPFMRTLVNRKPAGAAYERQVLDAFEELFQYMGVLA